jgi:hypothetical protein
MKNYINTIFPLVGNIGALFGVKDKNEFRKKLEDSHSVKLDVDVFDLEESERIDENTTLKNLVPGAKEIPLQMLLDAGFSIKAYLKDETKNCLDDYKDSGVIIINIQHEDPNKALLADGFSMQFDAITEIEVANLNALILNDWKPGIFGANYKLDKALKVGSMKIRDILLEREEAKKIREERIQKYLNDPELQKKDTKKLLENLKFKYKTLAAKNDADQTQQFTQGALKILGDIAGINDLKSFDDLKNIPVFKQEIEKGGSFADQLNKFCELASKLPLEK